MGSETDVRPFVFEGLSTVRIVTEGDKPLLVA